MLKQTPRQYTSEIDRPSSDLKSLQQLFSELSAFLRRQFPLIALVFLCSVGIAGAYLATASRRYTSMAQLVIDTRKTQVLQQQSGFGAEAPLDSPTVDSQVEILKSESLASAVVKDARLTEDPEFVGDAGGLLGGISSLLFGKPNPNLSPRDLTRLAAFRFQDMLYIKRLGLSYVIEIYFTSASPETAARLANALAEAYIVDSLESKYQSSRRAAVWLQDRMKEIRAQASAAERAVNDYKAKNNIVDAGGRLLTEQQLAELNSSLTAANAQTAEAQARLDRIEDILRKSDNDPQALFANAATVTDTLKNDVITRLRQQYLDMGAKESSWSARYGSSHLAVVNLRNQMREIRRSIADELHRISETYKSDLEIAKSREDAIRKRLADTISQSNDTSQAQIVLRELESNAQSSRALADNFLQLYMVSIQQQSFPITEARVITEASPSSKSTHPKTVLVLAIGSVGGLALAVLAGLLRDISDRVFRTDQQIQQILGLNCLAVVPKVPPEGDANRVTAFLGLPGKGRHRVLSERTLAAAGLVAVGTLEKRYIASQNSLMNQVIEAPFSRFAEAIRSIKLAVDLNSPGGSSTVLGTTSSIPNEGKSTVCSSLAQLFAQSGKRTVLIDGDMRNPSLTKTLAPGADAGLIELLLQNATLEQVVWTDPATNLAFIPAVSATRVGNSSELLSSRAMHQLFSELRTKFDRIILDLPPLAPVIDVRGTVELVDSYIMIVEWGKIRMELVEHGFGTSPLMREKTLGVVLNKADIDRMRRYEIYRGRSYYNEYYQRYGYTD